ncbi:MAG: DUF1636 family protein [Pseudomonadota bacterium]
MSGEVQICIECGAAPGERLHAAMAEAFRDPGLAALRTRRVACLGNCDRRCRLNIADADRWTWFFGDLNPERDVAFLSEALALWLASPNGLIPKSARPQRLVDTALGRSPPVKR